MTDGEIERMTLCIAQMAATLKAADAGTPGPLVRPVELPTYYAARARELYEAARDNVSGVWADRQRVVCQRDAE